MKRYQLDPKRTRQLTPAETRRLEATPLIIPIFRRWETSFFLRRR
jgi:hypothetical protein